MKRPREQAIRPDQGAATAKVFAWGIFEDAGRDGRFVETFLVESWLEHLRKHERVTKADRVLQGALQRLDVRGEPTVTHFVSAEPRE
jgi:hypothetical protein